MEIAQQALQHQLTVLASHQDDAVDTVFAQPQQPCRGTYADTFRHVQQYLANGLPSILGAKEYRTTSFGKTLLARSTYQQSACILSINGTLSDVALVAKPVKTTVLVRTEELRKIIHHGETPLLFWRVSHIKMRLSTII